MYLFKKNFLVFNHILPKSKNILKNIIIQIKITDFGFAKYTFSDDSYKHSRVGTPIYMSPQLLEGRDYKNKCDIWSVGMVFYEMLYGKPPWQGRNEF